MAGKKVGVRISKDVGGGLRGSTSGLRFNPREAPEFTEEDRNFGRDDPKGRQNEEEKKRDKKERRHHKIAGLQHVSVKVPKGKRRRAKGDNARNDEELSEMTGPASSTGYPLDVSTGAKTGGGSAMGGPNIMTGKFMELDSESIQKRQIVRHRLGTQTIEALMRSERRRRTGRRRKRIGHDVFSARNSHQNSLNVHGSRNQNNKVREGTQKKTLTTKGLPLNPTATNSRHRSGKSMLWYQANPQKRIQKLERGAASRLGMPGLPYLTHTTHAAGGGHGSGSKPSFSTLAKSKEVLKPHRVRRARGSRKPPLKGGGMANVRSTQYTGGATATASPIAEAGSATASPIDGASILNLSDGEFTFEERLLKTIPKLSNADLTEFKQLVRELRRLLRSGGLKKAGLEDVEHDGERPTPNAHRKTTSSPTGATEIDPDDDPRYWGAHPIGLLLPRRGHQ